MSVAQKIENLLIGTKQDKTVEKFQEQYNQLLRQGIIQRKGYNLAGIDVIGDKTPSVQNSYVSAVASAFNK